jgi:hypothetical protein
MTLCAAIVLLLPTAAVAEVMDKEPSLASIWCWSSATIALGLVAHTRSCLLGTLVMLPGALFLVDLHRELWDPFVGPAISAEAGTGYAYQSHAAALLVAGVQGLGLVLAWRRTRLPRPS